jgi:hypothetical protein
MQTVTGYGELAIRDTTRRVDRDVGLAVVR